MVARCTCDQAVIEALEELAKWCDERATYHWRRFKDETFDLNDQGKSDGVAEAYDHISAKIEAIRAKAKA